MPLYLTESDVESLLDMPLALKAVEEVFAAKCRGEVVNLPRRRIPLGAGSYNLMAAAWPSRGVVGHKSYTATSRGARFHVSLYCSEGRGLLAIVEAGRLGQIRTGAASGVATRFMALPIPIKVGIIGSGYQAQTQLEAIATACDVSEALVYSRTVKRRNEFALRMSEQLNISVSATESPQLCIENADVVVTITSSKTPVIRAEWVRTGTHINAAGNNSWLKRELDVATVKKCDVIATDDVDQAKIECGELMRAAEAGHLNWDNVIPLHQIVSGSVPGRRTEKDITLFASQGVAFEDLAVVDKIYRLATERGVGTDLSG